MAWFKVTLAAFTLLWPGAAAAETAGRWAADIARASLRFGVPEEWISRVVQRESGARSKLNRQPITSRAGALGLMQLMPGTWRDMRLALALGSDPQNPTDNILAGTAYLRLMYDRFGYPGLFGAYNAGPARYAAYLAGTHPLPAETRAYVAAIAPAPRLNLERVPRSPVAIFAFTANARVMPASVPLPFKASRSALFVPLSRQPSG